MNSTGNVKRIFEGQVFQIYFAVIGTIALHLLIYPQFNLPWKWFVLAVSVPLVHQLWVAFFWRMKLYTTLFDEYTMKWFSLYQGGFVILALTRIISIYMVSFLTRETLNIPWIYKLSVTSVISITLFMGCIQCFDISALNGPLAWIILILIFPKQDL